MSGPQPCTVFLPVYNEEEILVANTQTLLKFFSSLQLPFEIIIGSNGSTDNTCQLGKGLEQHHPEIRFFHIPCQGPGRAFRKALNMMRYEKMVCLDMDMSVDLSFIPESLECLETAAIVIGSKKMGIENRSILRRVVSGLFIFCSRQLLGIPFDDYSIGAKAYRKSILLAYRKVINTGTFYVHKMVYLAWQDGRKVVQIPVNCQDFRRSHFNLYREGAYRFSSLFRLWLSTLKKRNSPRKRRS